MKNGKLPRWKSKSDDNTKIHFAELFLQFRLSFTDWYKSLIKTKTQYKLRNSLKHLYHLFLHQKIQTREKVI